MCITQQESSVEQIMSHVCPTYWYHLGFVGHLDFKQGGRGRGSAFGGPALDKWTAAAALHQSSISKR